MSEQQKKLAAGGVFALIAVLVLYFELRDPSPPPHPPATVVSGSATSSTSPGSPVVRTNAAAGGKGAARTTQQLDPTLHMGAMLVTESLAYSGSGRNIFSGTTVVAPVAIPKPLAGPRPKPGPITTTFQVPVGPPPLPPIDLKFFGTETRNGGQRQAFLLRGEDVFLASAGEIVQRRYKVLSIAPTSIVVEDLLNNNRQTLPLSN